MKDDSRKPDVKLIAILTGKYGIGPEEIGVYGALGCFEEKSPTDLFYEDYEKLSEEGFDDKKDRIFNETSGRGHGSVLDQNRFTFVIEDIPRIATLQLCLPQYLEHLQQSLRRASADRGFYCPDEIKNSGFYEEFDKTLMDSFKLYDEMKDNKIPAEDARFLLPLYTRTNIQTTGNAREFMHLHKMSSDGNVPSIVSKTVEMMLGEMNNVAPRIFRDRETNYETLSWYPSSQLFGENETMKKYANLDDVYLATKSGISISEDAVADAVDNRNEAELSNLKHIHFDFVAPMSLACFHQATRQRTWDQSIESIYDAAERGDCVVPPSVEESKYLGLYKEQNDAMLGLYNDMVAGGVEKKEAIGAASHALKIYDMVHVNGWNAVHSIGKRTCKEAQWEIRNIAEKMAEQIREYYPELKNYVQPQGIIYGKCPERNPCGYCKA